MKNKGFSLIELLAVIVILAIIGAITVAVIDVVNRNNRQAAEDIFIQNILESAISHISASYISLPDKESAALPATLPNAIGSASDMLVVVAGSTAIKKENFSELRVNLLYLVDEGVLEAELNNPNTPKKRIVNMETSYVSVVLINPSNKSITNGIPGRFDGRYFYRVHLNEI